MRYIEDLKFSELTEIFNRQKLVFTEKFDGSYIDFSYDPNTDSLTAGRDKKTRYHDPDEWPDEPWCDYFRYAHRVCLNLYFLSENFRIIMKKYFSSGKFLSAEILNGKYPNIIKNPFFRLEKINDVTKVVNTLVFHTNTFDIPELMMNQQWFHIPYNRFIIHDTRYDCEEIDGSVSLVKSVQDIIFKIGNVRNYYFEDWETKTIMHEYVENIRRIILSLGAMKYDLSDRSILGETLYDTPLSHFKHCDRPKVIEIKNQFKKKITECSYTFLSDFSGESLGFVKYKEGVVISSYGIDYFEPFKLIYPSFKSTNKNAHWVKHALVGGRRPPRPSFLSRTKNWYKEDRLKRLRVLVQRYKKHRSEMNIGNDLKYDEIEINFRTMILFGTVQRDIENGR